MDCFTTNNGHITIDTPNPAKIYLVYFVAQDDNGNDLPGFKSLTLKDFSYTDIAGNQGIGATLELSDP